MILRDASTRVFIDPLFEFRSSSRTSIWPASTRRITSPSLVASSTWYSFPRAEASRVCSARSSDNRPIRIISKRSLYSLCTKPSEVRFKHVRRVSSGEPLWNLPFPRDASKGNMFGLILFLRRHHVTVIFGCWYSLVNTPPVCRGSTEVTLTEDGVRSQSLCHQPKTGRTRLSR